MAIDSEIPVVVVIINRHSQRHGDAFGLCPGSEKSKENVVISGSG